MLPTQIEVQPKIIHAAKILTALFVNQKVWSQIKEEFCSNKRIYGSRKRNAMVDGKYVVAASSIFYKHDRR
jgi:hypothetical protein